MRCNRSPSGKPPKVTKPNRERVLIGTAIIAGLSGVLTWSFLEYVIHRFLGHKRQFRWTPFGKEHTRHHIEGDYFAPTSKKLVITVIVVPLVLPALVAISNTVIACSFAAGLLLFYSSYEVLHRRLHTHAGFGPYARWARRHHFHHHFVDARTNHGVTSPLWDIVFRTYRRPTTIKVPPRLCMSWLINPQTGAIIDSYASSFQLGNPPATRGEPA